MNFARIWVLVLTVLFPVAGSAQSFQEALVSAYNGNADLQAARANLRTTDELVGQARAGWLPTVIFGSSAGQQSETVSQRQFSQHIDSAAAAIQVQQPLFDGGRTSGAVASAESTVQAGRADLLATEQVVLLSAASAYQDVLRDRALLDLSRQKEALTRKQWDEIGIRFRAGQLTQPDVDQAHSRYLAARVNTASQQGQLQSSIANFQAVVGVEPGHLTPPPLMAGLPKDVAATRRLADANSPVVVGSLFRERAARAEIKVARAGLLPSVSASIDASHDYGETIPRMRTTTLSATLNLIVPLYQGGIAISRLRAAQETVEQNQAMTAASRRNAIESAVQAYAAWTNNTDAAQLATEQVQVAEAAYTGVQRQAALGARSTFELLGQLDEVYESRALLISLTHDSAVASYQLLLAVGRFTASELHLPVSLYNPVPHYQQARSRGGLP